MSDHEQAVELAMNAARRKAKRGRTPLAEDVLRVWALAFVESLDALTNDAPMSFLDRVIAGLELWERDLVTIQYDPAKGAIWLALAASKPSRTSRKRRWRA